LSFKPIAELLVNPAQWWPTLEQITSFETYKAVLRPVDQGGQGFLVFIKNSGIIAAVTVFTTLTVGILAAYAVARLNFFGKRTISVGILLIYLFPVVVVSIPLFVIFSRIGIRSSLYSLMIVYLASTLPVALYMLRGYFQSIPASLEEAGQVDGLTRMGVVRKITIPLAMPAIAAVGLYVFMIAWNEFLYALLFVLDNRDLWTLSLGVAQLDSQEVPKTMLMAGSVIISIPVIFLFFAAEKFLTEGLTAGGVKG
jgi:multiple sugar transport system permease protein